MYLMNKYFEAQEGWPTWLSLQTAIKLPSFSMRTASPPQQAGSPGIQFHSIQPWDNLLKPRLLRPWHFFFSYQLPEHPDILEGGDLASLDLLYDINLYHFPLIGICVSFLYPHSMLSVGKKNNFSSYQNIIRKTIFSYFTKHLFF